MRRAMLKSRIHRVSIAHADSSREELATHEPVLVRVDRGDAIIQVDAAVDVPRAEVRA